MQIYESKMFPAQLPVIVEDELFLYPFMITPLFLNDEENIEALNLALESQSPILVVPTKSQNEGAREFDAIYDAGVIGTVMRKVPLPDGRVKILFQGTSKGRIVSKVGQKPLRAIVDVLHEKRPENTKSDALLTVLREKVRDLAALSHFFPPDLLKTIEESAESVRAATSREATA